MSLSLFHNQSSHSLGWWHHCLSAINVGSLLWPVLGARRHPWLLFHRSLAGKFSQVCIPEGKSNDIHCSLRHIRYLFIGHGPDLQQYLAVYKMVTVLLVALWSRTLSGLIQRNIFVMAYPFAACADWLVGCSRHPVSSLLAHWLGFRFTILCASVCMVQNTACVLLFAPICWLISVPVVVGESCLSMQACGCPMCLCTFSRIDRNPSADSWFVGASMGSSAITWCSFLRSASFSRATSVAVPRVLACTVLNSWPAKALSVNPIRKLTTLPSSPIAHAVGVFFWPLFDRM